MTSAVPHLVPLYLLEHIIASEEVDPAAKEAARRTLEHTRSLTYERPHGGEAASTPTLVPPYILEHIVQAPETSPESKEAARRTLESLPKQKGEKGELVPHKFRDIFTAQHHQPPANIRAVQLVAENVHPVGVPENAQKAYDYIGNTWDLMWDQLGRDSIDNAGMSVIASVDYGLQIANAFWLPAQQQLCFGNGDNIIWHDFTTCVDVVGHEFGHGINNKTANLEYLNQSGALSEHIADVFGIMVKQKVLNQKSQQSDWLIGEGLFFPPQNPRSRRTALRSMKAPGTAYFDPGGIGEDRQVDSMSRYVTLAPPDSAHDYGGVHINSGIPNKAFYNACMASPNYAWQDFGKVWYKTMLSSSVPTNATFQQFADVTFTTAWSTLGGVGAGQVMSAWRGVGIYVPSSGKERVPASSSLANGRDGPVAPNPVTVTIPPNTQGQIYAISNASWTQRATITGDVTGQFIGTGENVPMKLGDGTDAIEFGVSPRARTVTIRFEYSNSPSRWNLARVQAPVIISKGFFTINQIESEDSPDNDWNDTILTMVYFGTGPGEASESNHA
ncbi:hypothetical protein TRVA0_049S00980 [Trichomonascus vanleenenianus]|uniref:uncharacterized protein n=1 Tax=Trichomonascus vanleenenianus TaxID=2268995 RepID=UPI003ECA060D